MNVASWSAVGTLVGALVTLIGMAAALYQAHIAKAAAKSAEESVAAAVTQAQAAVEQASLLRQQVDAERADRDRQDAPTFVLRPIGKGELGAYSVLADGSKEFVPVTWNNQASVADWFKRRAVEVTMSDGLASVTVEITVADRDDEEVLALGTGPYRMIKRSVEQFTLITPYRLNDRDIEIVIKSAETSGHQRSWISRQALVV